MNTESIEAVVVYLARAAGVTFAQLLALGAPALILVVLLSRLSGLVHGLAYAAIGRSLYLALFGWFGTAIHETGHLLVALPFGFQIASFRPFAPNTKTGVLGSVDVRYNGGNLFQILGLFFVGIAPVLFGTLVIFLALYALFQEQAPQLWRAADLARSASGATLGGVLSSALAFLAFVFDPRHFVDWRFYVFLYIAFSVGSSIQLSNSDVKAATPGCLFILALVFLFNVVMLSAGAVSADSLAWLAPYCAFFYAILVFAILLDLLAIAILWLPASARSSAA
jgi:hypothetical protein